MRPGSTIPGTICHRTAERRRGWRFMVGSPSWPGLATGSPAGSVYLLSLHGAVRRAHDQGFGFVPDGLEGILRSRALCTNGTREKAASRVRTTYGGYGHGALAALRRWKLLPLALLDALSPASLEERHDRCRDRGEEHEQEELLLLAALLLLFAHVCFPSFSLC